MIRYKGYILTPSKNSPNLYSLATEGKGGKIPNCLSGLFTKQAAVKEIESYVAFKGVADAKDTSKE